MLCYFWHLWLYYVPGHMNPIGWRWNIAKQIEKCSYLLFILYHCYTTWLVFGVSSFRLQQCMHFIGHWFHQLTYNFHLNDNPFFVQLLPKVILASGEVFMKSKAPIHFVLEVFDRIHVGGLWTPWQYYDCVIVNHLTINMLICFGLLSCWNTHSFASFLNFTNHMLRMSCKMLW